MHTIAFIYVTASSLSVIAALPQLHQLWMMKDSSEFNLFSWVAWTAAQFTALAYAVSIASLPYLIVNILWVSFYMTMVALILKYRHPAPTTAEQEQPAQ